MTKELDTGVQLSTSSEEYSPFDEFRQENTCNYRLGFLPSFSQDFSKLNYTHLNVVFFRVCNAYSESPFLTYLVYKTCSDMLEFPYSSNVGGTCEQGDYIKSLLHYVSSKAGIQFYSKVGIVGRDNSQFILCEELNNTIPYDESLRPSFFWVTSTELVQDEVMGYALTDNIREFVQNATGACRLFKNESIVQGARVAFLCCRKNDLKRFEFDFNYKFTSNTMVCLTEYKLAQVNSFFSSMPTQTGSFIHNHKLRDEAYVFRVVLPNNVVISPCLLETGETTPLRLATVEINIKDLYILSRHKLELNDNINTLLDFLKSKGKPIFLS